MGTWVIILVLLMLALSGVLFRERIIFWFRGFRTYTARCGHQTKAVGILHFKHYKFQRSIIARDGRPDFCLECLQDMIIPCAWCGESIIPDDPVTLYSPIEEDYEPPEGSKVYSFGDPLVFVGCLRMDCAETGADRAGFWISPGEVSRVISPLEQVMGTGIAVHVGDLSKQG